MPTLDARSPEVILNEPYQETEFSIVMIAVPAEDIVQLFFGHDRFLVDVYVISRKVGVANFVGRLCIKNDQVVVSPINHFVSLDSNDLDEWGKIIYSDISVNHDLNSLLFKREVIKLSQNDKLIGLSGGQGVFALSRQVQDGFDISTNESSSFTLSGYKIPNYYMTTN